MAKKKLDTGDAAALRHNPFAALSLDAAVAPPSDPPPSGPPPLAAEETGALSFPDRVVVRREKKGRGGKTITRVQGIPSLHRAALAGQLKRNLGCGASIEGEDIILSGAHVERAARWLQSKGAARVSRSG